MAKIVEVDHKLNWTFYCPGCKHHHGVSTTPPSPVWSWNGDVDKPTFSPSIRVHRGPKCDPVTHLRIPGEPDQVCHFFIKDGVFQFLDDCTHELAGKYVNMEDVDN